MVLLGVRHLPSWPIGGMYDFKGVHMKEPRSFGVEAGLRVARRWGLPPSERADCTESGNCPDVFELECGNFAINGERVAVLHNLPEDAGCSDTEQVIFVPREVLLSALRDLPTDY